MFYKSNLWAFTSIKNNTKNLMYIYKNIILLHIKYLNNGKDQYQIKNTIN